MKTETKILSVILIVTLVLFVGGIYFLSKTSTTNPIKETKVSQINYSKGQKIGSDSAKVKLVEFSDFQCPACLAVEPTVRSIRTSNSQVQLIYRYFPLSQHSHSKQASYLAEAAGEQGKFWQMHDKLFETQNQWSILPDATAFFNDLVKQLGLDEAKVKVDLDKETLKSKIDEDIAEGQTLGVNSTPTFFVNGQKLNLQSFNNLNTIINEELKK